MGKGAFTILLKRFGVVMILGYGVFHVMSNGQSMISTESNASSVTRSTDEGDNTPRFSNSKDLGDEVAPKERDISSTSSKKLSLEPKKSSEENEIRFPTSSHSIFEVEPAGRHKKVKKQNVRVEAAKDAPSLMEILDTALLPSEVDFPNRGDKPLYDMLLLKLQAERASLILQASSRGMASAALSLERLMNLTCQKEIENRKACNSLLSKVEGFGVKPPEYFCIKYGKESSACREAFQKQFVVVGSADRDEVTDQELAARIHAEQGQKSLAALETKVIKMGRHIKTLKKNGAPVRSIQKFEEEQKEQFTDLLQHKCQGISVGYREDPPRNFVTERFQYRSLGADAKDLQQLMTELGSNGLRKGESDTAQVEQSFVRHEGLSYRVRRLPEKCFREIKDVLEEYPFHSTAICLLEGEYSPYCQAVAKRSKAVSPKFAGRKKYAPGEGLKSF